LKIGVVFSGGKDSTRAIYEAQKQGDEVCCLITICPISLDSFMFHYPNIKWTNLQAKAMNIPLIKQQTRGVKEDELRDLKFAIKKAKDKHDIQGIYTGAVASSYQKIRFEKVASELELKCISPLWNLDGEKILRDLEQLDFEVIIVSVAAAGLDSKWLGSYINSESIEKLMHIHNKYDINLSFEGGEAETFVLDCPLFNRKIEILEAERIWEKESGIFLIHKARLNSKETVKDIVS